MSDHLDKISKIKDAFEVFDKNKDGRISIKELGELLDTLDLNVCERELQSVIDEVDVNGSGKIDFQGFMGLMSRKMRETDSEEELIEVFKIFDKDGSGMISANELKIVMGDKITEEEIEEIFKEGDMDEDGLINYEDFVRMIINK